LSNCLIACPSAASIAGICLVDRVLDFSGDSYFEAEDGETGAVTTSSGNCT